MKYTVSKPSPKYSDSQYGRLQFLKSIYSKIIIEILLWNIQSNWNSLLMEFDTNCFNSDQISGMLQSFHHRFYNLKADTQGSRSEENGRETNSTCLECHNCQSVSNGRKVINSARSIEQWWRRECIRISINNHCQGTNYVLCSTPWYTRNYAVYIIYSINGPLICDSTVIAKRNVWWTRRKDGKSNVKVGYSTISSIVGVVRLVSVLLSAWNVPENIHFRCDYGM